MRHFLVLVVILLGVLFLSSCSAQHSRECSTASACLQNSVPGECIEAPNAKLFCAYPDTMCSVTGKRWGVLAGDGLAGDCVGAADAGLPDDAMTDAGGDAALAPQISLTPVTSDFGAVVVGMQSTEFAFVLSNTGGSPTGALMAEIDGPSNGDFVITSNTCPGTALTSSGTCSIRVRFRPTTGGAHAARLHLTATPGGEAMASLSGDSITMGSLTINPATQDFGGTLAGGQGSESTFTVRNTGQSATGALTAAIQGGTDFTITMNSCTGTLGGLANCTIKVRFQPQAAGARNGSLSVTEAGGSGTAAQLTGIGLTTAALALTPGSLDFGALVIGGQSPTTDFTVRNTGGVASGTPTVTLTDLTNFAIASNGCTAALDPGASCTLAVRFTASAPAGPKAAMLTVSATPGATASATLSGLALTQGALTVSPTSHGYGSATVNGSSPEVMFTVMNTGGAATGALGVSLTGNDPTSFSIASNTCTGTLAGGGSCTVGVRFSPSTVGVKTASLSVNANPGGAVAVTLSGTSTASLMVVKAGGGTGTVASTPAGIACGGTCSASFSTTMVTLSAAPDPLSSLTSWSGGGCSGTGSCVVMMTDTMTVTATFTLRPPAFTLSPAAQDFGPVTLGSSVGPVTFTVTNTGGSASGPLAVSASDSTSYTVMGGTCAGMTLAGGASCTLTVRFNPMAPAGSKPATLMVSATPGGSATAGLSGSGLTPGLLMLSPTTATFGSVTRGGMSAAQTFTVMNTGGSSTGTLGVSVSDSANFTISSNDCPATLGAGASCMVGVRFTPASVGAKQNVSLTATASPGGTIASTLSGTGTAQVNVTNGGGGTVTSAPAGITCGASCSATFSSEPVVLTATADGTHTFAGWSGGCTGLGTCSLPLDAASKNVTAIFTITGDCGGHTCECSNMIDDDADGDTDLLDAQCTGPNDDNETVL